MIQDPNFINPLTNPILFQTINRFVLIFLAGLVLIFLLNRFQIKGIWKNNLGKRYISWLVISIVYLTAIFFGGYPALFFLLGIMVFAIWEVSKLANLPKAYTTTLYLLAIISIYTTSFYPKNFYMLPLFYFIILSIVAINSNKSKGLPDLTLALFTSIWIIFALSHFILLGHLNNSIDNTKSLLILVAITVALADIGAYVVGKLFSKTKLNKYKIADKISPNKTYPGVLGNILGAGIGIAVMYFAIASYTSIFNLAILAILIGTFGVVGDLTESLFKRNYNAKDSSQLIPGHGGILDRIDSLLRVIIVVYYFFLFVI
jgi:phosphatidate cytidylyltransferase|tara:strand:+ start:3234 stop:4184 length:951 start_codon:yes stop_codon:yes gene_type:complete